MDMSVDPDEQHRSSRLTRRWLALRNRLIGSARFQKWAAANLLTRPVARRRATTLFDLVAGFTYSQTLLCVVESGLCELLADGAVDEHTIADRVELSPDATRRLLRAAAALELVEEVGERRWMLGEHGAALAANPGVQAMIRHHRLLYADLADPMALLRRDRSAPTALSRFWSYAGNPEAARETAGAVAEYSALMAASQALVAEQALAAYDFGRHRAVLDIGGGHGAFAQAIAQAHADLRLGIVDLPGVLQGTATRLAANGLEGRITLHPADFFHSPLPAGYDCLTLVRILHDHDDPAALEILRAARSAMPPGGRLLIVEPLAETRGARGMGDAYFGWYLWAMGSGRPRRRREIEALAASAGFRTFSKRTTHLPTVASVLVLHP